MKAPYEKTIRIPIRILSKAGPEESCLKQPAPSGKAKYDQETDSEQVP